MTRQSNLPDPQGKAGSQGHPLTDASGDEDDGEEDVELEGSGRVLMIMMKSSALLWPSSPIGFGGGKSEVCPL